MTLLELLWLGWIAMVGFTGAMYGYRSILVAEEEGHLVLPVVFAHPIHHRMTRMQLEQRLDHLAPLLESCDVLTAFTTILLIGYYVDWAIRAIFI